MNKTTRSFLIVAVTFSILFAIIVNSPTPEARMGLMQLAGSTAGSGGAPDPEDQFSGNPIFSVGTTATELDNEGTITVASNIATFSVAFPVNVGVGDVVQYDADNDSAIEADEYGVIRGISTDRTKAYLLQTDGGNVTNTTASTSVYDIFRAYVSLANWESNTGNANVDADIAFELTDIDLTDSDDEDGPLYIAVYADGDDNTDCTISGWSTDSDDWIEIFAPNDSDMVGTPQGHQGTYDTGYQYTGVLDIAEGWVLLKDFEVDLDDLELYLTVSNTDVDGDHIGLINMIVADASNFAIYLNSGYARLYILNSIVVMDGGGFDSDCIKASAGTRYLYMYHSTLEGATDDGFDSDATGGALTVYNSISINNTSNDYEESTQSISFTDGWAEDTTGSDQTTGTLSDDIEYATHTYILQAGSDLANVGSSISGLTTSIFGQTIAAWLATDISGNNRNATTPDIGAKEMQ